MHRAMISGLMAATILSMVLLGCEIKPNGHQEEPASDSTQPADKLDATQEALKPLTYQTSEPLTIEQARQNLSFPLPDSATNIQYASYRQWLAALDFVRFEATVEDCCTVAKQLIAQHNTKNPNKQIQGLRPFDPTDHKGNQPTPQSNTSPLSAPWFDPQSIRKGLVAGETSSNTPSIWIDTEHGVFYYQFTD